MKLFKVTQSHETVSYILAKDMQEALKRFSYIFTIELISDFVYMTDSVVSDIIQSNSQTKRKVKR